jgi:hypothetical protein
MYIVKMKNFNTYKLTDSEYKAVMTSEKGAVIPRLAGAYIEKGFIGNAYEESMGSEIEGKKELQAGRLHDGTRVRKHFGQWVDDGNLVADDRGNYVPVRIDPHYYPEVARDCVISEVEFEKLKELPVAERLQKMLGGSEVKQISGGFSKIEFKK